MPEGDTVYRTARLLDRALQGQVLTRAELRVPSHATADLVGARVVGTVTHGKHLLTRLEDPRAPDDGWTLHTHLKMEGAWQLIPGRKRWTRPDHQVRAILATDHVSAVGYLLGVVELVPTAQEDSIIGHLGPDLLGSWDEDEALRRLTSDPDVELGDALRDQRNLAGLGNMYVAELCFIAGLDPRTPIGQVSDRLPRLLRRARQMLELNKERPTQSTTGDLHAGRRTWVYGQQHCLRCETAVMTGRQGPPGRERASYRCPNCQPSITD